MKKYRINVDIYGESLVLLVSDKLTPVLNHVSKFNKTNYKEWKDKLIETYEDMDGAGIYINLAECINFIVIKGRPKTLDDLCTIIHESFHVTANILSKRGIELSQKTEEAYTYLQEYIVIQILEALNIKIK
jgi:DNA-directed RNA polymerase subunit F